MFIDDHTKKFQMRALTTQRRNAFSLDKIISVFEKPQKVN